MIFDLYGWSRWSFPYLVSCLLALPGCGEEAPPPGTVRGVIPLEELPSNILDAAKKALPGVRLSDAWKNIERETKSLQSYEIRGRSANGKVREVRVSLEGKILEME
jgi:hypothetical protein